MEQATANVVSAPEHLEYTASDGTILRYSLFMPLAAGGRAGFPLILALHYGAGPDSVPAYFGAQMVERLINPALGELGAVIVAPDAPGSGWANGQSERAVVELLAHVRSTLPIDERRTLITGFSMGGMGTWFLAARHPSLFRAAIPIASFPTLGEARSGSERNRQWTEHMADSAGAWTRPFLKLPVYAIHSIADEVIPIGPAETAVARLREQGADAAFVRLNTITHHQTRLYVPALHEAVPWIRRQWARR